MEESEITKRNKLFLSRCSVLLPTRRRRREVNVHSCTTRAAIKHSLAAAGGMVLIIYLLCVWNIWK